MLDVLGISGPVDWVGNAWGGHVGVLFAARYQERCRNLISIGAPIQKLSPKERRSIVPMIALYRVAGLLGFLARAVADALLGRDLRKRNTEIAQIVEQPLRDADRVGM